MSRHAGRKALLARMRATIDAHAERTAVRSRETRVSYREFSRLVGRLCRALRDPKRVQRGPIGLLPDRSATAYAAMWAAIALGRPYVPLNPGYPTARLRSIVRQAKVDVVICTETSRDLACLLGITPENVVVAETATSAGAKDGAAVDWSASDEDEGNAYVLFTSGSTGEPKGVPISYESLAGFIDNLESLIDYRPGDVCSQICELSFDVSAHEIYLALLNGCALCPARQIDLFNPARYVSENGITIWTSVPSLARVVLHHGTSVQGMQEALGTIRLSIFNGEALTSQLARNWSTATRGADIWNTYGPTECTVAVSAQLWRDDPDLSEVGVVSIGTTFPDCKAALLDGEEIVPVGPEISSLVGELLLATPQRFDGYLDPALPSPFITDDSGLKYYRTGDRVLARDARLFHLGRLDHQVKIRGHRIELLEVEHHIRRRLGSEALAVIAYPQQQPTDLILFLTGDREPPKLTADALGLPAYMVPRRTILVDALPFTAHGKLDRNALLQCVGAGS